MSSRARGFTGVLVAVGLAVSVAACSEGAKTSVSPTNGSVALALPGPGPNPRQADRDWVELCKDYSGTPGPAVSFTVQVDIGNNGTIDQTFQTSLAGGTCQDIWLSDSGNLDVLTITETVPSGYTASSQMTRVIGDGSFVNFPPVSGNVATDVRARNNLDAGSLVIFTNTFVPPPPPPPGIGGCTPGYWKQEQHFDSWTAPYTPSTLFSSVFENAFPGMTLLQVLEQGGGGLDALGRHTVAALLNAASSGVSFGLTPAQVIAAFNGVFPGGNLEGQKNTFATANERGCPLN